MLDILLDDYLSNLPHERLFDAPFLALLPFLGFYDVHYTHGSGEFGKDFIAKKREGRKTIQFSFQLKRHVSQSEARQLESQLLQAITFPRTHPNFDLSKPHQPVLVVIGHLTDNASIGFANLNEQITQRFNARPLDVWGRSRLASDLEHYGLTGMHRTTVRGVRAYSEFYALYGEAMEGELSPRKIELFGRSWLNVPPTPLPQIISTSPHEEQIPLLSPDALTKSGDISACLLRAAIEASLIGQRCQESNAFYEAIICDLALWRAVLHAWHCADDRQDTAFSEQCRFLHERIRENLVMSLDKYIKHVEQRWRSVNKDLVRCMGASTVHNSGILMLTYPVKCLRFVEMVALRFFLANKPQERKRLSELIVEFVAKEPGCTRPISERFAVSIVWPILVLGQTNHRDIALDWIRKTSIWLADRHQHGVGLARLEAPATEEATMLLGASFSFFTSTNSTSLLACVLADLAAWLSCAPLYEDIINDWKSVGLNPNYFQAIDSEGAFRFEAPDVLQHPRVTYDATLSAFHAYDFASHIRREVRQYKMSERCGISSFGAISLLLRDRYFPGLWPQIKNDI